MSRFIFPALLPVLGIISAMAVMKPARAKVEEVYLTPHFHYDPVFEEDQRFYTEVGFDRMLRFLDCLRKDPEYRVVFSEIDYLKPFFDTFPQERENILRFIAEGRIETGGSYNEPNEMSIGGEGIIRNILYGKEYHQGALGDKNAVVYQPFDVFGHTLQLSQILAKAGFIGVVWRKGNPPIDKIGTITVPGLPPDFMDLAPDGTLLHHRREHYKAISGTRSAFDLFSQVDRKKILQNSLGLKADFGLLSTGDFAAPEPWLAGNAGKLLEHKPPIILAGPSAYFRAIAEQMESGGLDLPQVTRDFSLYHAGTALSHVDLKIANRMAEQALFSAEEFGVMAAVLAGDGYPEIILDKAWRQVLFNQHHDAITGTSNDRSYFDLLAGYREAVELANKECSMALTHIASQVDLSSAPIDSYPVVVFNPSGWKRTDVVSTYLPPEMRTSDSERPRPGSNWSVLDSRGRPVPMFFVNSPSQNDFAMLTFLAADLPAMGYKTFFLTPDQEHAAAETQSPEVHDFNIENEFYSVTVDTKRGGTITRLVDKKAGRTVIDPLTEFPGNELIVIGEDKGPQYPAWELSTTGVKSRSSEHEAKVTVEQNPVRARLVINGSIPGLGDYMQEIKLYTGVKRIDFVTTILNPKPQVDANDRSLWVVRIPARLNGTAPVIEDRFFAAARRRSLKPLEYRTDLERMNSCCAPYSADKWVEEGSAVRLDIHDNENKIIDAMSLQLCEIVHTRNKDSIDAARRLQRTLIQRGVTCTPSFSDEDRNKDLLNRNFRFVIDTGGKNEFAKTLLEQNIETGQAYAQRLTDKGRARLLLSVPTEDTVIGSIPTLILGAVDSSAMNALLDDLADSITERKRIDLSTDEDARGNKNPMPPDDYGIALINSGNILHSFDANGTIVMGLFHSAQWSRSLMDIPFGFPEDKTHRYTYALYPHSGDWRDADTYKTAMEFNSPLMAVMGDKDRNHGALPPGMSAFDIQAESSVLTAVKAAGNQSASMLAAVPPEPGNMFIMRFYEAEGQKDKVGIKFFKPVAAAFHANLLEQKTQDPPIPVIGGDTIEFDMSPNAVETILVEFKVENNMPVINRRMKIEEPSNTLFSNYWEINRGAAWMFNSPVSINLDFPRDEELPVPAMIMTHSQTDVKNRIKEGENVLNLMVSNNSSDKKLKDRVQIQAPEFLAVEPSIVDINLAPGQAMTREIKVTTLGTILPGYVRASISSHGMTWFDTVEVGDAPELDATAEIRGQQLRIVINNNQGGFITGLVEPIGSTETWPSEFDSTFGYEEALLIAPGGVSLTPVVPRIKDFSLEPDQTREFEFDILNTAPEIWNPNFWLVVRIAYNGELKYIPIVYKK